MGILSEKSPKKFKEESRMRNLKRALSLALASVMVMGLMVVGTGASYVDVSSEQNQEAIEVLQAVGVMTGDENGNFNPDANVTRNEMAVVMSNLLDYTVSSYKGTAPFSDVPSWAEPYVAACYTNGIIAGYDAKTFGGSDSVTTGQAALMLLKALGYFQEAGDFGQDWLVATVAQGSKIDLFDGVDTAARDALTRNEVAQLVLNALKAEMVEIVDHDVTTDGKGNWVTKAVYDARTSTDKKYGKITNEKADGNAARFSVQLGEDLYSGDLQMNDEAADDFQRPATEWKYVNDTIGTFTDKADAVYTKKVTAANIYSVVGKSTADDLEDGTYALYNYIDGEGGQVTANIGNFVDKNNTTKVNGSGNGMLTEVYVDTSAKKVTIVSINTYVFQASTDYNTSKESVDVVSAGDTEITLDNRTLEQDDFDVKDVKADDYLLITAAKQANGTYDVQTVAKAEVLTGSVDGYKIQDSVIIDGTTYKYSLTTAKTGEQNTQYTVGQTAAVVLDAYGYVIAVDEAVVSSNYVFVSEFAQPSGLSNGKVVGHAYFTDGTTDDITIKDLMGDSNKANMIPGGDKTAKAGWYTYSKNSNDEYSLYAIEAKYSTSKIGYAHPGQTDVAYNNEVNFLANGASATGLNGAAIKANNDTIIVVDDGDEVTYYTGVKNLPDVVLKAAAGGKAAGAATVNAVYKTSNSYAAYVFINVTGSSSISGGEDSTMVYFVKYDGQHKTTDNEIYYTYKVLVDGKEEIVKADSQVLGTSTLYSAYYKARTNSDDEITTILPMPTGAGEKFIAADGVSNGLSYSAGTLTVGSKGYTLADNCKITLVVLKSANAMNKDKSADYEAQIVTAKELSDRVKDYNVTYNYELKATEKNGSELEELYVTAATGRPTSVPSISNVTVNGNAVTGYATIADAVAHATVLGTGTSVTVNATIANATTSAYDVDGDYKGGDFVAEYPNTPTYTIGGAANEVIVTRITASNANGNANPVYVAVKSADVKTVSVKNTSSTSAIQVTIGDETKVVAKGATETFKSVAAGSSFKVTYEAEMGKTVEFDSDNSAGATFTNFNSLSVDNVTANVTIQFK